jgi:hypothetical protein
MQHQLHPNVLLLLHVSLGGAASVVLIGAVPVVCFSGAAPTAPEGFLLLHFSLGGSDLEVLPTEVLIGAVSVISFSGAASTAPGCCLLLHFSLGGAVSGAAPTPPEGFCSFTSL